MNDVKRKELAELNRKLIDESYEFGGYFRSGNGVPRDSHVRVSREEYMKLSDTILNLTNFVGELVSINETDIKSESIIGYPSVIGMGLTEKTLVPFRPHNSSIQYTTDGTGHTSIRHLIPSEFRGFFDILNASQGTYTFNVKIDHALIYSFNAFRKLLETHPLNEVMECVTLDDGDTYLFRSKDKEIPVGTIPFWFDERASFYSDLLSLVTDTNKWDFAFSRYVPYSKNHLTDSDFLEIIILDWIDSDEPQMIMDVTKGELGYILSILAISYPEYDVIISQEDERILSAYFKEDDKVIFINCDIAVDLSIQHTVHYGYSSQMFRLERHVKTPYVEKHAITRMIPK